MPKKTQMKTHILARFMLYVLGHRPDEFGLVPDEDGFVPYKELLWALHEEPGWRYVRKGHINEVLLSPDRHLFQALKDAIRALDRRWRLGPENPAQSLPTSLFVGVRRRSHRNVMEKGLAAARGSHIVLSPDRDMAMRIGCRRDQKPVLLEISTRSVSEAGITLKPFGELFIADQVPAGAMTGPPVPKKDMEATQKKEKAIPDKRPDFQTGTFVLDMNRDPDPSRRPKGKKRKGWKEEARKIRRGKRR
ncbi:MAG: RNA 2'-phosphotransferase [Deltaproteobacteria bacterium]|nr:RNA 2'-phosphotransferase [Deltaproteobacteria bacterium]